jgi:hypothetical protein
MSEDRRGAMRNFLLEQALHEFRFNPVINVESVEILVRSTEVNCAGGKEVVLNGMAIAKLSHEGEADAVGLLATNSDEMADGREHTVVYLDRDEALALLRVAERTWPGILNEAAE